MLCGHLRVCRKLCLQRGNIGGRKSQDERLDKGRNIASNQRESGLARRYRRRIGQKTSNDRNIPFGGGVRFL